MSCMNTVPGSLDRFRYTYQGEFMKTIILAGRRGNQALASLA